MIKNKKPLIGGNQVISNYLDLSKDELLNVFIENLLETNRAFNYYVDWRNASAYSHLDIELNAMNTLIRSSDFDNKFRQLLKKIPTVVATFPYLFALARSEREKVWSGRENLIVVNNYIDRGENYNEYNFAMHKLNKGLSDSEIEE